MTVEEIDHDLELLAAQAKASGDEEDGPGLILLSSNTWCREEFVMERQTTSIIRGIRYRGVRVLISSKFEDKVLDRREALVHAPGAFEPFEPKGAGLAA